jgi:hypothetical protein
MLIFIMGIIDITMKELRNTTGLNLNIPAEISAQLSHKVIDLRLSGADLTKADLILSYVKRGLIEDKDGQSEEIGNPGINDRDGQIEVR